MLSWNLDDNVGYVLSRDNDVIAHEKTYGVSGSGTDGIICALHGGAGFLNNWAFLNLRIEQAFSLVSIAIELAIWVARLAAAGGGAAGEGGGEGGGQGGGEGGGGAAGEGVGGAVLIFVSGLSDIEEIAEELQGSPALLFVPVHGDLGLDEQV